MTQTEVSASGQATGQIVIATYDNYADAERAVDYLSDNGFPVERTAIVGRGLSIMEQVTGRLTLTRAAGQAALSGAVLGVLLGLVFGIFNWISPLVSVLLVAFFGAIFGAIAGALIGLATHAMTGGRRDFSSITAMQADRYQILVDAVSADQAITLLESSPVPGQS